MVKPIKTAAASILITLFITTLAVADEVAAVAKALATIELAEVPAESSDINTNISSSADKQANKSYLIPAVEIVGFDFLLNQFNRRYSGISDYDSNLNTIRHNLHSSWVDDKDPFSINQLGHPYQGSIYHGFARSAGLNYWESLGYTLAGSAFWEIAGEKVPPSKNDMISTGFGGSFLGEAYSECRVLCSKKAAANPVFCAKQVQH